MAGAYAGVFDEYDPANEFSTCYESQHFGDVHTSVMESEADGSSSKIGASVGANERLRKIGGDGRPYSGTIARCLCEGCQGQESESLSNHVVTDVESEIK